MKPCPFCGSRNIRWYASTLGSRCKCMYCHAEGPPVRKRLRGKDAAETQSLRKEEAERLWNGRDRTEI